jgi:hypothetical protein
MSRLAGDRCTTSILAFTLVGPVTNLRGQIDGDRPDIEGSFGDAA